MDLDPDSWGGLELGLKIGPVKTSTAKALTGTVFKIGPFLCIAAHI